MTRKVGMIVMLFFLLLGAAFFIYGAVTNQMIGMPWGIYIGAFGTVYGVFAGTSAWHKVTISKNYHPEMDDKHPEVQAAAIEKLKGTETNG